MYAQIERPKENKSRIVTNSDAQKKSNVNQGFAFVDNRLEAIRQRKLQKGINDRSKIVQKKKNTTYGEKNSVIQRVVAIAGSAGAGVVSATITYADLGTGTSPSVASNLIPSHAHALGVAVGAGHPYHHERGHLIGRQLGGDGGDVNNLVGLSDGTNAPLMADIEGEVRDILTAAGAGSSVWVVVTVSYAAGDYAGPAAAPHVAGMVGKISYDVYDHAPPGHTRLYHTEYPNGVLKNHHAAGCC